MISKNELKYYASLLNKKFRKLENKFIAEGKKIIEEGLLSNYLCEKIFVTNSFKEENSELINKISKKGLPIEILKPVEFQRISDTKTPQGVAAVFIKMTPPFSPQQFKDNILIYLDDINDPGNLGTIIRNCDWFSTNNILLSEDTADVYNPKTLRASMGSVFHLNIYENITLDKIIQVKKSGYNLVCTDLGGKSIFNFNTRGKLLISLSNESKGPSQELLSIADHVITIPRKGKAESLNVASASAIILAELTK
jgi:RNA methyltransferase, TrmH family